MSKQSKKSTKRVLSVSLGVAAITAVEGLACGNPVAPRYERAAPWSTEGDASVRDASIKSDAGVPSDPKATDEGKSTPPQIDAGAK